MLIQQQNRHLSKAILIVAACFGLLSLAQVVRPLNSIDRSVAAIIAAEAHLTRHATQEVSPRIAQPQTPGPVGLKHLVAASHDSPLSRILMCVTPLWPMENWPMHRRVAPASADNPAFA
jgi:hypothetical protein